MQLMQDIGNFAVFRYTRLREEVFVQKVALSKEEDPYLNNFQMKSYVNYVSGHSKEYSSN